MSSSRFKLAVAAAATLFPVFLSSAGAQESLPSHLVGTWRITRALPTQNAGCWAAAPSLVGTTLTYRRATMRWHGGEIPINGVVTRTLTAQAFQTEAASTWGAPLRLADLNIQAAQVREIDLQHEDADITGATTEVPGDSILLTGRNTIVVSACGSFFEATRVSPTTNRPPAASTMAENGSGSAKSSNWLSTSLQTR